VLAVGVAVPLVSYTYAHRLVLLGAKAGSPSVRISTADAQSYASFAATGPSAFVVLGYSDLNPTTQPDPAHPGRTVAVSSFASQLAMLHASGFSSVTPAELTAYLTHGTALPRHAVLITFDGGRERDWTQADNVLGKYGFTAVVFVDPALVGKRGSGYLSWTQLATMSTSKRWQVDLDITGSNETAQIAANGVTGPAVVEHVWLPATHTVETTAQYKQRVATTLRTETAELLRHDLPAPRLVSYPFDATYPLVRVTVTFGELASVTNASFDAGVLSLATDAASSSTYQAERLLPRIVVYSTTTQRGLFNRIVAAS